MDQSDDPRELERKINQAARIVSGVSDPTTVERLRAWIEELRQRLRQRREARRIKQVITQRAKAIWEEHGRPFGRDLEFWLQAESEVRGRDQE
jgi:methylthioribose-1-phosphate isomerase